MMTSTRTVYESITSSEPCTMHRLYVGQNPWPGKHKNGQKAWHTGTERNMITRTSSLRAKERILLG